MSSVLLVYSKFEYEKWKSNPKTVKQFKYEKISPNKEKYNSYLEKIIRKPITNDAVNGGSGRQKQHYTCGGTKTFHSLAVKCVYYHVWNRSPVQVRCIRRGAQGWCTGTTLRDGGSGWGTHVHPWLIHVNVWQKPLQYCKVISFQLKKKRILLLVQGTWVRSLVGLGRSHMLWGS